MVVVMRKGPWTEQEDMQLVCFVGLFGDRRWDFIAKVSGLNRTGKSCRLRWVNYLHPGLKRGRITPQEERLIIELHSRWGNRWSRIARRLPGRTDNEIKNFWRTHVRKKAQERKCKAAASAAASAVSPISSSSSLTHGHASGEAQPAEFAASSSSNSSGMSISGALGEIDDAGAAVKGYYSMDEFWNELPVPDMAGGGPSFEEFGTMPSPIWDHCSLWRLDDDDDFRA